MMPEYQLTNADRCACTAQAYVLVLFKGADLLFCKHCYDKHADNLFDIGAQVVVDERERLYEVAKLDVSPE